MARRAPHGDACASAKGRNDATAQKNPAFGGAKRLLGCVPTLARCPTSRCAPLLPEKPFCPIKSLPAGRIALLPEFRLLPCRYPRGRPKSAPASVKQQSLVGDETSPKKTCRVHRRAAAPVSIISPIRGPAEKRKKNLYSIKKFYASQPAMAWCAITRVGRESTGRFAPRPRRNSKRRPSGSPHRFRETPSPSRSRSSPPARTESGRRRC